MTEKDIMDLVEAVSQVLDDFGRHGYSACAVSGAQLRIAYEPFIDPDERDSIMEIDEAKRIIAEIGG